MGADYEQSWGGPLIASGAVAVLGPNTHGVVRRIISGAYGLNGWSVCLVPTVTGESGGDTLDVIIEHSLTGTDNWGTLASFTQKTDVTGNDAQLVVVAAAPLPFLRVRTTEAGTGTWTAAVYIAGPAVGLLPL